MTEIPFSHRWKLWLIPWSVALVLTVAPRPALILYAWLFPFGLMEAVGWKHSGHDIDYLIGWLPYIALTIAAFFCRLRPLYVTLYVILCILLLLNIAGCHQIAAKLQNLH